MKMTIVTKEWDKETGDVTSENKYTLVKKKGKDGLMHTVSEKTEDMLRKKRIV